METPGLYSTKADETNDVAMADRDVLYETLKSLDAVETRLDSVETRLDSIEYRLTHIEGHLVKVDRRLDQLEIKVNDLQAGLDIANKGIDQIINILTNQQKSINGLVERFDRHLEYHAPTEKKD